MTRLVACLALVGLLGLSAGTAAAEEVARGRGAVLRGLDKLTGAVTDLEILNGDVARLGTIIIALGECRYPVGNPSGDAYAYLAIGEDASEEPVFTGWMVASSPALNAMDHRRYDVWVMRCITE